MVQVQRRGETQTDYDRDFIGRPLCIGDTGVLLDKGMDPDNCPACARADVSDEVLPPERRFAVNVIHYKTRNDGSLVTPFSCSSVVWQFGEGYYNKLVGIAEEHGAVVGKDLILGPCQVEAFQKYDIMAGGQNVWSADDRIKAIVEETHANNRLDDLQAACGRKTEARWIKQDVDKIAKIWAQVRGETRPQQAEHDYGTDAAELSKGLDELLAGGGNPHGVDEQLQAQERLRNAPTAATPAPEQQAAPVDFASLLEGLKP
jgi:hypothetical protein